MLLPRQLQTRAKLSGHKMEKRRAKELSLHARLFRERRQGTNGS